MKKPNSSMQASIHFLLDGRRVDNREKENGLLLSLWGIGLLLRKH
jgi:hypothetical protein